MTLKQRLAALSMPSTSSSNSGGGASYRDDSSSTSSPILPKSPGPRIRAFFSPNGRNKAMEPAPEYSQDKLQEVMTKLIFQAGVDYE